MTALTSSTLVLALAASISYALIAPGVVNPKSSLSYSRLHMATWSDSRAVQEYQNFLASGRSEPEKRPDGPSVIIRSANGESEMADALIKMGMGDDCVLVSGQEIPAGGPTEFPIYITLPPSELRDFLKNLPTSFKDRPEDFVFLSGGLKYGSCESVLKDFGYARDTMTQFLISGFQTKPIIKDTSTSLGFSKNGEAKIAGECAACGKWAGAIEKRLERNAIRCKNVFYREWRRLMWERTAYDAVFNLVGAVRTEPTTLADVALYYGNEVSDMLWGISGVLRGMKAITLTYGFEERLFGIGESTGSEQQCTIVGRDMFSYIYEDFLMAPMLNEYLSYAQDELGLLRGIEFMRASGNSKPVIRQGNLRADGVL